MRNLCLVSKKPSFSSRSSPSTPGRSFESPAIDRTIESAAEVIEKWNTETSTFARVTSLFYESKREAMEFMKRVIDLQNAMHLLVSEDGNSEKLVRAQNLMQLAMKRLQKEFYQILSINRAHLDPESVSTRSSRTSARSSTSDFVDDDDRNDDVAEAGDSITEVEEASSMAMADLRSIAECMIASGYAKECVSVYKVIRKSIIDEGIYRLGIEKLSSSQVKKMPMEVLELKIKNWLEAVKVSMGTLFTGEKILCDQVFKFSDSIRESCFSYVSKEGAMLLFGFPEMAAKSKKNSPAEKIFRLLDMYTAIAENWQEIEAIFSFESTSTVRSQALNSLIKLGESTRSLLAGFESGIQKDCSKTAVPGGGVHPLAISAMNYLTVLADYGHVLADILAGTPPPDRSSLRESYFNFPDFDESPAPDSSLRLAWLVFVLLCKIDGKAKQYKDLSLQYLFLANNLQHVVSRARTSNLKYLLGDEWIAKHDAKVRQFAASYERLAWSHVWGSLPADPTAEISREEAKYRFKAFNASFETAYNTQSACVVPDRKLRDEIKASIARNLVPTYREFYLKHKNTAVMAGERDANNDTSIVRFAPDNLGNFLSDLFFGKGVLGISSVSSSSSSHRRHSGSWF